MADKIGQQIGNYRLARLLGSGGFANVYLGEHIHLKNRQVAIKILHDTLDQKYEREFLKEAQIIAELEHAHIVRILDFGIDETPYLVMEYAGKGTLRDIYPKGSLVPLERIIDCSKQIASALRYAHNKRIIHRDLKPQNFLVRGNNEVILSDFGIATIAQHTTLMKTEAYAGTVFYSAPEQLLGKPRLVSDQYALGIIVYEWLCGSVPFTGETSAEILLKHVNAKPQPLRERIPSISPMIETVVMRALSKNPDDRFGDITEFIEKLEKAANVSQSSMAKVSKAPVSSSVYIAPTRPVRILLRRTVPARKPPVAPPKEQRQVTLPAKHSVSPVSSGVMFPAAFGLIACMSTIGSITAVMVVALSAFGSFSKLVGPAAFLLGMIHAICHWVLISRFVQGKWSQKATLCYTSYILCGFIGIRLSNGLSNPTVCGALLLVTSALLIIAIIPQRG